MELDSDLGMSAGGIYSRALGSVLRRLATTAARCGVCVLVINQTRIRLDSEGQTETSAGGPPLKLYAAARIQLAANGRRVKYRIVKNTFATAFLTGILEWHPAWSGSGQATGFVEPL
jgi:RecA/RadA recombinase